MRCWPPATSGWPGTPLVAAGADPIDALWLHPAAIVAHDTAEDPIFFFGNCAALIAFEIDFAAFVRLPSRLSAEPALRAEREALLARVTASGMIRDYSGIRLSATGRRFRIDQAVVWNLIDEAGVRHGQAAMFDPPQQPRRQRNKSRRHPVSSPNPRNCPPGSVRDSDASLFPSALTAFAPRASLLLSACATDGQTSVADGYSAAEQSPDH